jgi:HlyD family secretion protein
VCSDSVTAICLIQNFDNLSCIKFYNNMNKVKNSTVSLLVGLIALTIVIVVLGVIGYLLSKPQDLILQGYTEATEYRVSGKVPGRIEAFIFREGDKVRKGDTVVLIDSPEIRAKMMQASAAHSAAEAQNRKASGGARQELIMGAYEMWQKAKAGVDIAQKSYNRILNLYKQEVVSAQKKDEAEAMYNSAVATEKAAKAQYDMAKNGAQKEDKEAARAMVDYSQGAVTEVNSYLSEISLVAPASGEVSATFPKVGELVGTGAPIMTITDLDDIWFTFNIREDLLKEIKVGTILKIKIPALSDNTLYEAKVTYMQAMASYATWKATKVSGQFDVKTFEIKAVPVKKIPDLRPGMSVLMDRKLK